MISSDEFTALSEQGHNRIPVVREVFSDLDTPLSVYLKLADGPYTYLLESVEGGETWGRYSIIGLPCRKVYKLHGTRLTVEELGATTEQRDVADPLAEIERIRAQFKVPQLPNMPEFSGGLVGYFGFETIGYIEPKLARWDRPDQLGIPDVLLMLSEEVAVFDNLKGRLYLIVHADPALPQAYARAQRRLDELAFRLRRSGPSYPEVLDPKSLEEADFRSSFTREEYCVLVEKAKEHIRAGDRAHDDFAGLQAREDFRRRTDDLCAAEVEEIHVRRRIQRAQRAIHVDRPCAERHRQSLRRHHLKDVAGANILFRLFHKCAIFVLREGGFEIRLFQRFRI